MPAVSDQDILGSRVLIIDDEAANVGLLETLLADEGFEQVLSTTDGTWTGAAPITWGP